MIEAAFEKLQWRKGTNAFTNNSWQIADVVPNCILIQRTIKDVSAGPADYYPEGSYFIQLYGDWLTLDETKQSHTPFDAMTAQAVLYDLVEKYETGKLLKRRDDG